MLIDQNLVFFDSATLATGDSAEVGLTSFLKPGREDPIPVCFKVVGGDITGATVITIKLQCADKKGGSYEDVPGSSVSIADESGTKNGMAIAWRYLPNAGKPWLKVNVAATGSGSGGKIFAAVVREVDLPYEKGMYIDKGIVKG